MASEPFSRGTSQIVPEHGDIDAILDCLLDSIRRLPTHLDPALFSLCAHTVILASPPGNINHPPWRNAEPRESQ